MKLPIYLDYMATTPLDARVLEKMLPFLQTNGNHANPSSAHRLGREAKANIGEAAAHVAALINASPEEIIWTSGATEAINLALKGAMGFYQRKGKHIITTEIEHKACLETCRYLKSQGCEITYLPVNKNGLLDIESLKKNLRSNTVLVSIAHVNNEIGVIQDIMEIGKLTRQRGVIFHVDAAQSVGKIPVDVKAMNIDLLSLSSHKIYGPKGCGALFVSQQPRIHLVPLIHGGEQQGGLRSGTLATPLIVGTGEACAIAKREMSVESQHILMLRDTLWNRIKTLPGILLNGDDVARVPHNLNVSFPTIHGEALHFALETVALSAGSSCASHTLEPSHVLHAIKRPDHVANSTLRISLGRFTTSEEIDYAADTIYEQVRRLQEISPL